MSVIGFDIGNVNCVIAAAKRGGIDVLLNDEAKRETPGVVSFGDKQRFLGSAGAALATANPKSTISQIKRLIGKQYKEPSVQEELKLLPFVTSEGPRGGILIELEYMKEKMMFTPVEILGMLFKHLKQIAEKNLESAVVDCVIGIPSYFTDLQRREYLDAAYIAGLSTLMLMHDGTAIALGYGMYKTDLSDKGPTIVVFVDIGHCDTQVTVAAFQQGGMKVLSHASDPNLGGRDFDEVLFKHFADKFNEQYNIDVYSNPRACIRLRASCEKLKKVLSANTEAPLSIECLIEDKDVRGIITREEFENLSRELLDRVAKPCIKAVKESGKNRNRIYTIELVGSGSRVPAITKTLAALFNKEPTRTLNASECVARGCALRCAMLSPTQQVRGYEVQDCFPYSIGAHLDEGDNIKRRINTAIPKCSPFPVGSETFTQLTNTTFCFHISYINETDLPAGVSPKVGHFMMGPSHTSDAEKVKVLCKLELNKHGIIEIKFATVLEDEHPSHKNVGFHSKKTQAKKRTSSIAVSDNLDAATTKDELVKAQEREQKLLEQDKKVEQAKDQRNTLESFVYDTRSKLQNAYKRFVTELENEGIRNRLQETEDWLYEDNDDECDEQIYTEKLKDLKKLLEPIENRYKDEKKVQAKKPLLTMIEENRLVADSHPHEKKMELINACTDVEQYLSRHSPENYDLIGWSSFIKKTMDTFKSICEAIQSKLSFPEHVEPVHNKVQAAKPLLSMIEKHRSHADSLPNENKMKLIKACEDVEQYLSHHFSKNYDPIGWSYFIEETMDIFIRCCEEAIEYKPSSPEHPEAVELDQSCNHVDPQTGNPTDAKQTGKSIDGTDKPIERNQICKPVEPNGQPRGKEPNKQTRETGPTKQTFGWEPNAQTRETGPNKQNRETGPVSQTRGWEPNVQTREITGPNKQTRETGPVRQTRGWEPNVQTREIGPNVQTCETGPSKQTRETGPVRQTRGWEPNVQTLEIGPNVQTRETGPSKQVRETRPSKQVCETGPTNQTFGWEPNAQTCETGPNKQTRETGPVRQTCGWEPNVQTREIGPNVQTRETGPSKQVRETGPSKQVRETGPSKQVRETGPSKQVCETGPDNQVYETVPSKQTVNMGQTDKPFDSEQMDIPDHMQVDG